MSTLTYVVKDLNQKVRLSDFVHIAFPHLISRKAGQKSIKKELVKVNGILGYSYSWLDNGDKIELSIQELELPKTFSRIDVLYEDDHLAVIVKPAGINVSGNRNALSHYFHSFLQPTKVIDRIYPYTNLHRLDRDTKGLLVIAKSKRSQINIQNQFYINTIEKTYHTVVIGKLNIASGEINAPIDGKEAISRYQVLKTVSSHRFSALSLVEITLITGRKHQIRRHFSELGHPIVGDKVYNFHKPIGNGKGMFLFATEIKFKHPITEDNIVIKMEIPPKVNRLMNGH